MESSPAEAEAFAAALLRQLEGRNRDDVRADVARISGETVSRGALQQWLAAKVEPSRRKVRALEQVFGLGAGALSRHLGYLPADAKEVRSVLDAIDQDTKLSEKARRILKGSYRELTRG